MPTDIREELMNERTKELLIRKQQFIKRPPSPPPQQQKQPQQLQPFIKLMNLESPKKLMPTTSRRGRKRKCFEISKQTNKQQQQQPKVKQQQRQIQIQRKHRDQQNLHHSRLPGSKRLNIVYEKGGDDNPVKEDQSESKVFSTSNNLLGNQNRDSRLDPQLHQDVDHQHQHQQLDSLKAKSELDENKNHFSRFTSLQDIKNEIKMWTDFSSAPNEYDVCHFTEYLMSLLESHDTRRVFLILKYIQRLDNLEECWQVRLKTVVTTVQAVVRSLFSGQLKL
ncbi:hypothetical protein HELRODRAFT_178786 [Helobdella robusta]|uniref:DNA repair protein Rev1 C-terminal domain-containing protein n=1 Tax=Helobdella robusta TaxID=6412 RepID=T1FDQ8_HELRO|nr:hypothetical protein HELRODRAFT_178786 [Helobdella robusta]ESN96980.1 hypothetical protein HELRODRAFT_178786 [Helobdella robusta]